MATITWLHLSDLHFRDEAGHAWDEDVVLGALLADVKKQREAGLAPDLILVSGDIAHGGRPAEYELARRFFDKLLTATGLSTRRLCLVPGNHDVDRGRIGIMAKRMAPTLTDRSGVNEVLGDANGRHAFLERFEGYAAFVNDYLGHTPFDDDHYFQIHALDLAGQRLAILGLNSAWLARGGEEDRHKLALGERQVRAALEAAEEADLKIALFHHPFGWLQDFDRADAEALLCARCDFILHGHMHQVGLLQARTPDSDAFLIAAGACYATRQYPNAYNYVQLDPASGQGAVHLRTYSDQRGGFWTKDVVNYRNVSDGVYRFSLSGEPVVPASPSTPGQGATARADHGSAVASGHGVAQVGNGNIALSGNVQGGVTIYQSGWQPSTAAPPAGGAAVDTGGYDLQVVGDLLLAAFTAPDLRRLFLYTSNAELRPLTRVFSPSDGLNTMVETTIQFCLARRLLPDLLGEVERANPRQYAHFAGRLRAREG